LLEEDEFLLELDRDDLEKVGSTFLSGFNFFQTSAKVVCSDCACSTICSTSLVNGPKVSTSDVDLAEREVEVEFEVERELELERELGGEKEPNLVVLEIEI